MNCHYCGTVMEEDRLFCLCCGTRYPERHPAAATVVGKPEAVVHPDHFDWEAEELPFATQWDTPLPVSELPALKLPSRRGLAKMVFLGLLTLMVYPIVIWCRMVTELNITASRHDGRRTMSYFGMVMLAPLTLGIYPVVWMHRFCARIGRELQRRGIDYRFGARDFWLWNVLGCLILVGPFVFVHRLTRAMNKINAHFNING